MTTFRNASFTRRNFECTNVIVAEAEKAPGENWIECDAAEKEGLDCLFTESANGTRTTYYGYL